MKPEMAMEAIWILILVFVPSIEGQCTFPESFNGTWITSFDGTWVTNSTHLLNYRAVSPSGVFLNSPNPTLDFVCFIQDGTKYVLRSAEQVELFTGFFIFMHTCIDLREITSSKYVYYYGTAAESTGLRFTSLETVAEVCTQTNHDLAYNQHIALLNGSETSGLTLCPPSIYGSYFYNTCNDSNSNTTSVDVCDSRQQLIYNYTLCNTTQMFTSEGVLDCVFYDDVDAVSYVTLYNRDSTTPDGSNTYQFVCLAIELSGSTVFITANPETCVENQSPTNISSPGQIIQFTPFFLCPFTSEEESPFDFLPIILGAAGFIALLLLIIIVVCCCKRCNRHKRKRRKKKKKKKKRKRKKKDEEAPSSDDEDDDDEESSGSSESRCSSTSSCEQQRFEHEEEKKSFDSGISEPAVTHRTDSKLREGEEEAGRSEKELVINDDGEKEVDDKASRPLSGQRSRMSDLPSSTLPEEEQPGASAPDPDEQTVREKSQEEQQAEDAGDEGVEREPLKEGQLREDVVEQVIEGKVGDDEKMEKDGDGSDDTLDTPTEKKTEDGKFEQTEEGETEDDEEYDSEDSGNEVSSKTGVYIVNQTVSRTGTPEQEKIGTKDETDKGKNEQSGENDGQKEDDRNLTVTQDHKERMTEETEENQDRSINDQDNGLTEEDSEEEGEEEQGEEEDEDNDEEEDEGDGDRSDDGGDRNVEANNSTNEPNVDELMQDSNRVESEHKVDNEKEMEVKETVYKKHDSDPVKGTIQNKINENETNLTSKFEEKAKEHDDKYIDKNEQQKEQGNVFYDDKDGKPRMEETIENIPTKDGVDKELFIIPPVQVEDERKKEQREDEEAERSEAEQKTELKEKRKEEDEESNQESGEEKKKKLHKKQRRRLCTEDDETKECNKIGQKKDKEHRSVRSLTTVLVSRHEEEKKRTKNKSKSESQRMKNLARKRTQKTGTKSDKESEFVVEDDDDMYSSDNDTEQPGERGAPFMKQYNNKKRIEHILDQQHYWSDPEADKESFRINESMTSIFGEGSASDSGSEYEELIGPDSIVHRVKKLKDVIDREQCSSDPLGTKRPKSFESLTSVEDPESPGGHVSKKRLNEHFIGNERRVETANDRTANGKTEYTGLNDVKSKTRLVVVRENTLDNKLSRNKTGDVEMKNDNEDSDLPSDFCDTDMDKLSERDSGLDDDVEDAVDVVLNKEQQAMIVAMLFDEEMNLRSQFARDENGRIIRRLDNTVIYDPHTGRFTFHKRLGRIFNMPRLRRNAKGRPTGGYIDDAFGPHQSEMPRTPSSKSRLRTASGRSIRSHVTTEAGSPSPEMKRSRGEGKFVGFKMPEDDAQSLTSDQLDAHKRGRRDIGSAIRRKLNKRLFRKKTKRPELSTLPDAVSKRAWTQEEGHVASVPYSRTGTLYGTQGTTRKLQNSANPEQQEMFRQGLERDKRILEERQDILNKRPVEAFRTGDDEKDVSENFEQETENGYYDTYRPAFNTSQSFYTDDGRLVVRERGCPELHRPATLFTIVRRQEDLEREATNDSHNKGDNRDRFCKSAPSQMKSSTEQDLHKDNTFQSVRQNGSESQLSGIDNNRLRKLLEELYKDKKYFDEYIESKEPESEEFLHSKGLAEHGRGYLLQRAEYWERRGPLPPKPPMTEIGWKMHRQQTLLESRLNSDRSSTVLTLTPNFDQKPSELNTLPGVVGNQNGDLYDVGSNESRA